MNNESLGKVGRYTLKEVIGEGGMGVVYRAFDPVMRRTVAIKCLQKYLGKEYEELSESLFKSEAIITGQLRHPNLISTYDILKVGASLYMVQEYFQGIGLHTFFKNKKEIDLKEILRIFSICCAALEYAHNLGIIHKDIKPGNILINDDGDVKIVDFGVSEFSTVSNEGFELPTDVFLGTPAYASPEFLMQKHVDSRTDIFSLGIVFYEIMTGRHPFPGKTLNEQLFKILKTDPDPLSRFVPKIPKALDYILLKTLAKEPDTRYQTMRKLKKDLDNLEVLEFCLYNRLQNIENGQMSSKSTARITTNSGIKILVVDNDDDNLELLSNIFKFNGYTVFSALNGKKALEIIQSLNPRVIISNIDSEIVHGLQLCQTLRKVEKYADKLFVAMTSSTSPLDRMKFFEAGVDDYIVKPFHPKELILKVKFQLKDSVEIADMKTPEITYKYRLTPSKISKRSSDLDITKILDTNVTTIIMRLIDQLDNEKMAPLDSELFWKLKSQLVKLDREQQAELDKMVVPMLNRSRHYMMRFEYDKALCILEILAIFKSEHPDVGRLLSRCRRELYRFYEKELDKFRSVPMLSSNLDDLKAINTPEMAYLLSRIDGRTTIQDLIQICKFDKVKVLQYIYRLKKNGLVNLMK